MNRRGLRPALATLICVVGVGLLLWGMWSAPRVTRSLIARQGESSSSRLSGDGASSGADVQDKTEFIITLDFPKLVKAGDVEVVRLSISPRTRPSAGEQLDEDGDTGGTAASPENVGGEPLGIQAKLEVGDAVVQPAAEITTVWSEDRRAAFVWTVRDLAAHTVRGTAWIFLTPIGIPGLTGERMAVSAQPFEVQRATLLGLTGPAARAMGAALVILATILGMPWLELALRRAAGRRTGVRG